MHDAADELSVLLPHSSRVSEYAILWKQVAVRLGLRPAVREASSTADSCRVSVSQRSAIDFELAPVHFNPSALRVHELNQEGQVFHLLAAGPPRLTRKDNQWRVDGDLLTPLVWMLTLQEEHDDLHRDRFGLVEGARSIRQRLDALSEPFFENVTELLRRLFNLPMRFTYPGGASWSVAVSCDVDVLADSHMPGVLSFLESHGVDRPTFMICSAIGTEKTIRDPHYEITNESTRRILEPLLSASVEIGLHGSYLAHDRLDMLLNQKQRLEDWCGRLVRGHRAHFYRFAYPRSWVRQYQAGLSYDASLGYPDLPGLRSGCASPTIFFDPAMRPVEFAIFPTAVLDQHFFWPHPWDEADFVRYASSLLDRAAALGCALNLDWHTYTWTPAYPGWWERLSWLLREARRRGAYIAGIGAVLDCHWRRWRDLGILTQTSSPATPANSQAARPRYYEQPELWGKTPDPYQVQVRADVLDLLPADVQSVLDLGCGDGYITNSLPPSLRVVGMDISAEALRYLRRPGLVASGLSLPFPDGAFDLVMANDVLEHLEKSQRETVLAEMRRVAKKYVLITSPHDEQLAANMARCADCGELYHVHWHHHAFRGEKLPRQLSPDFALLEVRYSGDVTLPPADPFVSLRHSLGMFRTWGPAVCPECGSTRQIGGATDSVLSRIIAAKRCEIWYGDLPALNRSSNRSEIMALYGTARADRGPGATSPIHRHDLRELDFTNPLQRVGEFTPGSSWAAFRLTEGMAETSAGITLRPDAPPRAAIEARLPVVPRAGDRIVLEVQPQEGRGTVTVYSVDGVLTKQSLVGTAHFVGGTNRSELVVSEHWWTDVYGAGLIFEISSGVVIHRVSYLPADKSTCLVDFVELPTGHNVIGTVDQGVRVSWGLTVESSGRVPKPYLALQGRPPQSGLDAGLTAIQLLASCDEVLGNLRTDHDRASQLAEERERLRDAAEQMHARIERSNTQLSKQCAHLERRLKRKEAVLRHYIHELEMRQGVRGGAKEFLRSIRNRIRGPVNRPRHLPLAPPWAPLTEPLVTSIGALRVLVLSHMFPHPNQPSSGTFVYEQVKALRVEGGVDARVLVGRPYWMTTRHPVRVWRANTAWKQAHDESKWCLYDGIPVQYLPYRIFGPWLTHGWSYTRTMLRSIEQLHREFPFDVIHAHTGYLDGSAGRAIAARFNKPLIITEHTGPFSMLMKNPVIRRRTLRSLASAARVIAVSRAQRQAIRNHWSPRRADQLVVVPNLVDTQLFHPPERWSRDPAAPRILFVGGFVPIKALPVLLDAFIQVRARCPAASLTLVGGGENEMQEQVLHRDIAQRGLAGIVRVLGHQPRREVARLMRDECDILVLPSISETFGCVVIEALASGKPVVATRCGGPEDVLIDESLGTLCPPNDSGQLAGALLETAGRLPAFDPQRIRRHAIEQFSQSAMSSRIVELYKSIVR